MFMFRKTLGGWERKTVKTSNMKTTHFSSFFIGTARNPKYERAYKPTTSKNQRNWDLWGADSPADSSRVGKNCPNWFCIGFPSEKQVDEEKAWRTPILRQIPTNKSNRDKASKKIQKVRLQYQCQVQKLPIFSNAINFKDKPSISWTRDGQISVIQAA